MIRQIIHDFLTFTFFINLCPIYLYIIFRFKKKEVDTDQMFKNFITTEIILIVFVVLINVIWILFFSGESVSIIDYFDDNLELFVLTNSRTPFIIRDALKDINEE